MVPVRCALDRQVHVPRDLAAGRVDHVADLQVAVVGRQERRPIGGGSGARAARDVGQDGACVGDRLDHATPPQRVDALDHLAERPAEVELLVEKRARPALKPSYPRAMSSRARPMSGSVVDAHAAATGLDHVARSTPRG